MSIVSASHRVWLLFSEQLMLPSEPTRQVVLLTQFAHAARLYCHPTLALDLTPAPESLMAGLGWLLAQHKVLCPHDFDHVLSFQILRWPTRRTKLFQAEQMACKGILFQEGQTVLMTFPKFHCLLPTMSFPESESCGKKARKDDFNNAALSLAYVKKLQKLFGHTNSDPDEFSVGSGWLKSYRGELKGDDFLEKSSQLRLKRLTESFHERPHGVRKGFWFHPNFLITGSYRVGYYTD